ncbi:MAG: lipopolysaccharide heptosyltransferase I [bacterium]|nr:lipopolysaccharide heptosyltransferase I [Betaproteobacteria bacterium]
MKTSSLGDVVHNLPVVDDLHRALPGVEVDWLVEQAFAEVPALHPGVHAVIPCALRRWRARPWAAESRAGWREMRERLAARPYDLVVDTQGLLKSALLARLATGPRAGFDQSSVREALATRFYQQAYPVPRTLHALERNRQLVAQAAGYTLCDPPSYGLRLPPGGGGRDDGNLDDWDPRTPFVVFLHATARAEKLWPESAWIALGREAYERLGLRALLPWGSDAERARAERLARSIPGARVPARTGLAELARGLSRARVVIGVDTGLLHLASAVGVRCIGIYVATDPARNGLYPPSVGLNLGGMSIVPGPGEVLAAVSQVTAWQAP